MAAKHCISVTSRVSSVPPQLSSPFEVGLLLLKIERIELVAEIAKRPKFHENTPEDWHQLHRLYALNLVLIQYEGGVN